MKNLLCLLLVFVLWSCNSDDDNDSNNECGDQMIFDEELFNQESPSSFSIQNAEIDGDCLMVTLSASGCDGSSWEADLVTDGLETTSVPPSRSIRVDFTNIEVCTAVITRTFQFYLGSNNNETAIYWLEGWDGGALIHNE
ncbi:hypothetical protein EVU94_01170 [Flavobacteriaceae bacterium 144Ye]|nr:hypothetical protein EVU94_01170 [Flavobacteriaceae bacterium 144Ye]